MAIKQIKQHSPVVAAFGSWEKTTAKASGYEFKNLEPGDDILLLNAGKAQDKLVAAHTCAVALQDMEPYLIVLNVNGDKYEIKSVKMFYGSPEGLSDAMTALKANSRALQLPPFRAMLWLATGKEY